MFVMLVIVKFLVKCLMLWYGDCGYGGEGGVFLNNIESIHK